MDKVYTCVERIRVIRGVNYGIITNEQLNFLFDVLNLNEEERNNVFKILDETNIVPIPEDEAPQKVRELYNPPPIKVIPKELDEETKRELRRKRYEKVLYSYTITNELYMLHPMRC